MLRRGLLPLACALLIACAPGGGDPRRDAGNEDLDAASPPTRDASATRRDGALTPLRDAGPGPDATTETDATCGAMAIGATFTPPDVLVLFDRSCSMRRRVDEDRVGDGPDDPMTRFQVARRAVERQIDRLGERVRWGIALVPEVRASCDTAPEVRVAPGPGRGERLARVLANPRVNPFTLCPGGEQPRVTPTAQVLEHIAADGTWRSPGRETFALLLTDGAATCGGSAERLADTTRNLRSMGVRTAVIGFGSGVLAEGALDKLDAVAIEGGLPRMGPGPRFYPAGDAAALDAALDTLLGESISCRFALDAAPPDPERLFVFVDGVELAPDQWRYDPAGPAVELSGASCARLRAGEIGRVNVVYGCPIPACEPRSETCDGFDDDCDDVVDEGCLL